MANYLDITENATTIEVETTTWKIVFDEAKGGVIDEWYQDGGATNYASTLGLLWHGLKWGIYDFYQFNSGSTNEMILLEASNSRCKLVSRGPLQNSPFAPFVLYVTVYSSGHIFCSFTFKSLFEDGSELYSFRQGVYTDDAEYSGTTICDNNNESPTYNDEWWGGVYSVGLNSLICYILNIDNYKARFNYASASEGGFVLFEQEQNVKFRYGESYTQLSCLYIGGNRTTASGIEADGEFLRSMIL